MKKWPRHKKDSKRRWKARIKLGRLIPHYIVMEHKLDISSCEFAIGCDCWIKKKNENSINN